MWASIYPPMDALLYQSISVVYNVYGLGTRIVLKALVVVKAEVWSFSMYDWGLVARCVPRFYK